MLPTIERRVATTLDDLIERSRDTVRDLDGAKRQQLKDRVESEASAEVERIVDRHKDSKNKKAIVDELSASVTSKLAEAVGQEFTRYLNTVAEAVVQLVAIAPNEVDDFEDISIEFEHKKGAAARSIFTSIGSAGLGAAGAFIGTALLPVVGTAIGGLLGSIGGGLATDRVGKLFEGADVVTERVGVSAEALEKSALQAVKPKIVKYVDSAMDALIETIRATTTFAGEARSEIDRFKKEVGTIVQP